MTPARAAELHEARELTSLLDGLIRENAWESAPPWGVSYAVAAFNWALPAVVPLLAFRGELGFACATAFLVIFLPAAWRSSERSDRDEGMRLFGPSASAVWLARLIEHLPWLAWASLCAAAMPLALAQGAGGPVDPFAVVLSGLLAALPLVRIYPGDPAADWTIPRRLLEFPAGGLFAVTVVLTLANWEPSAATELEGPGWMMLVTTAVWVALALGSRLLRRLETAPYWGIEDREDGKGAEAGQRSLEMGIPAAHTPIRSAVGRELLLARLSFEYRMGSAGGFLARLLVLLRQASSILFPVLIGVLSILLFSDSDPKMGLQALENGGAKGVLLERRVSPMALWIAALTLGSIGPRRHGDWMRGVNWRTQLGVNRLFWFGQSLVPAGIGCAAGLAIEGAHDQAVAVAALIMGGAVLRGFLGGLARLAPSAEGRGKWGRAICSLPQFLLAGFLAGLPLLHLVDVTWSTRFSLMVAAGAVLLGLVGAATDLLLRTEDDLAQELYREESEADELEDEL